MRLRQVALVSRDLDGVTDALNKVFDLKVAYRDPGVGHYGLRNAVLPAGKSFIEVVEPISPDASAGRFWDRWGRDAGYMIILQVADAPAETKRVEAQGVRVVDTIDRPFYYCAHFHPADFGGMLTSFDQQRTESDVLNAAGDWMPAGPEWEKAKSDTVLDLKSATLASPDPAGLSKMWAERLGVKPDPADPLRLPIAAGASMRFAEGPAGTKTSFNAVDLQVRDPKAVEARARDAGLPVDDSGILIGGIRFRPVA